MAIRKVKAPRTSYPDGARSAYYLYVGDEFAGYAWCDYEPYSWTAQAPYAWLPRDGETVPYNGAMWVAASWNNPTIHRFQTMRDLTSYVALQFGAPTTATPATAAAASVKDDVNALVAQLVVNEQAAPVQYNATALFQALATVVQTYGELKTSRQLTRAYANVRHSWNDATQRPRVWIKLRPRRNIASMCRTLFHEMGHSFIQRGNWRDNTTRNIKEIEAEAFALACWSRVVGYDPNDPVVRECVGYLRSWWPKRWPKRLDVEDILARADAFSAEVLEAMRS